jgi:hypothetical protein
MIRKFAFAVLAFAVSTASANAMVPMKRHHMLQRHLIAMCPDGEVKAKCLCASTGAAMMYKHQVCNVGQWCHRMDGTCTE